MKKDLDEVKEILRQPVKYTEIAAMLEDKRSGRGRPSLATQAENLSPEQKAIALQMERKLKEMGIRV